MRVQALSRLSTARRHWGAPAALGNLAALLQEVAVAALALRGVRGRSGNCNQRPDGILAEAAGWPRKLQLEGIDTLLPDSECTRERSTGGNNQGMYIEVLLVFAYVFQWEIHPDHFHERLPHELTRGTTCFR